MINGNMVGRTAGARIKESTDKDGNKVTQGTFSVYTKIDKDRSQWITCTCRGKFAEKIMPWLMVEREQKEDSESKDKYVSRLVNVIGRVQITREEKTKKHPLTNKAGETIMEIDVPYWDTSIVCFIDRLEFLDSNPDKSKKPELNKTTTIDDDELLKQLAEIQQS